MPDPQQQTTPTSVPAPDGGTDLSGLRVRTLGGIDLSGLRVRTIQQAKSELPQPQLAPPWEDEPRLQSAPTSKLGKAYADVKQWFSDHEQHVSEKYLAPFREGLDRLGEDLQQAGESGHTAIGGQLVSPARALLSGAGTLLKQVPVGRDIKSTALAWATPPELPEGNALSQELNAWERTGKEIGAVYHGGKTTVGEVDSSKLQQRDAGFYGPGFYVTKNEQYAKTYGSKVSQKTFTPDAKILDVGTIHPGYENKVNPDLQKEIEATQRAYLAGLPKAQKNPNLVNDYLELIDPKSKSFDLHSWIEAVNRHAEQKGYDAIRFSDGEIVVKNPKALATDLSGLRTRPVKKSSATVNWESDLPVGEFPGQEPGSRLSKTQQVPVNQIEATEKTNAAQVAKLKTQLQTDPSKVPPIVAEFSHDGPNDEDILYVVDGHHRLEAAKQLGLQEVPVKVHVLPDDWAKVKAAGGMEVRRPQAKSGAKELPAQPRLPDSGTHAAIKTDDGGIYPDLNPEKQRTHIMLAQDLGIPPERVVSGGWLKDGEYEGSERSDAGRWGEQARAKAAVTEKRAARKTESVIKHEPVGIHEDDVPRRSNVPDVDWSEQDLQDSAKSVDEHTIAKDYGPKRKGAKFSVYKSHIPMEDLPSAKIVEEEDPEFQDSDWRENYQGLVRSTTPPIKVRVNPKGEMEILDGNHRAQLWSDADMTHAPAWVIDERGKGIENLSEAEKDERAQDIYRIEGAQPLADKINAKVVGSVAKQGENPGDLDLRIEGNYNHTETVEKLKAEGFEHSGSSLVSPKEATASGKSYGKTGWKRAEHFEDADGRKIDVWHDEPESTKATKIDLSGLRVRPVGAGRQPASWTAFVASDGKKYRYPADVTWEQIVKADPGAKRIK